MPTRNLKRSFTFMLERMMTRGPFFKLLVIWSIILLVAIVGGILASLSPADDFHSFRDGVWWALLRLSDPGYLGEETAPWMRFVALVLTVVGLALFVGALVAVLTQWLNEKMERLSLGMTPITTRDHYVILGWTSRTLELAASLVSQGQRASPSVAILVDRVTPDLIQELKDRLGRRYHDRRIILRSGDPHQREHLERVNFRAARAIIIPGREFALAGLEVKDASTLKVVASLGTNIAGSDADPPEVAAEIADPRLVPVAQGAYSGLARIVPSDTVIARGLVLGVVSPGFSLLLVDVMKPSEGNRFLVHRFPDLAGKTVAEAASRFTDAMVVGVAREAEGGAIPFLESNAVIGPDDSLILLSPAGRIPEPGDPLPEPATAMAEPTAVIQPRRTVARLLILGWSGKAPDLLSELSRHVSGEPSVDVMASRPVSDREADMSSSGVMLRDITIRHMVGNIRTMLTGQQIDVTTYDRIIILASDSAPDVEAADASTIASHLVLRHLLAGCADPPHVVVELLDPANMELLEGSESEVVITPLLMADVLAAVVTQSELEIILPALWTGRYGFPMTLQLDKLMPPGTSYTYQELERHLRRSDLMSLALQEGRANALVEVLPDKTMRRTVRTGDEVVVMDVGRVIPS